MNRPAPLPCQGGVAYRPPRPSLITHDPSPVMAAPISYDYPHGPPGQDTFTAEDDLARLVETLHASGTLRVLNGLLAQFQDVTAVALKGLNSDGGRAGLANALTLGKLLGRLDADGLDRFVVALDRGLAAAGRRLDRKAKSPGAFSLLRRLRQPEVRRGLDALLTLVAVLGTQLHDPEPPVYSNHDGKAGAQP